MNFRWTSAETILITNWLYQTLIYEIRLLSNCIQMAKQIKTKRKPTSINSNLSVIKDKKKSDLKFSKKIENQIDYSNS